ncbi:BQ5605_C044g12178 [Microbotryum silenes-dioicae]|uniref:BQ5605_C033g11131 protein n=1 Tax=Microbotryum silenes-dioicae TaxID=796604 RepID=A0A2X0NHV1_9BASI|nr:BQ5605_C033g11131 [Microbotryum silenes-dioicae]SGZ31449.1 BQ5605_C044g12178 [Microbotryum silenes-dioicae]
MRYTSAQFDKAVATVGQLPKDGPVKPSQPDQLVGLTLRRTLVWMDSGMPRACALVLVPNGCLPSAGDVLSSDKARVRTRLARNRIMKLDSTDFIGPLRWSGSLDTNVIAGSNSSYQFYGLYKQATVGDVNTSRPGMMDFVGKAKWDAWKNNEGLSSDDAKSKYVEAFLDILAKNDNEEGAKYKAEVSSSEKGSILRKAGVVNALDPMRYCDATMSCCTDYCRAGDRAHHRELTVTPQIEFA